MIPALKSVSSIMIMNKHTHKSKVVFVSIFARRLKCVKSLFLAHKIRVNVFNAILPFSLLSKKHFLTHKNTIMARNDCSRTIAYVLRALCSPPPAPNSNFSGMNLVFLPSKTFCMDSKMAKLELKWICKLTTVRLFLLVCLLFIN